MLLNSAKLWPLLFLSQKTEFFFRFSRIYLILLKEEISANLAKENCVTAQVGGRKCVVVVAAVKSKSNKIRKN